MIHRELCDKFKFDHTNKWYNYKPKYILENEIHKLLWDFEIQTDHLISARQPNLIIINRKKRICRIVNFAVPADHRVKFKESEKNDKYLDLTRELKKLWNTKVATICNWCSWYSNQSIDTMPGGLGNKMKNGDHPNHCIIEIGQNTEKSPGDLRLLAVTKTTVKDHQLMLMWKTLKE